MSDEQERVARADRAQAIFNDELFTAAITRLKDEYTRLSIEGENVEMREDARKYVKLVDALPNHFRAVILDGHVAQRNLDEWNK